MTDWMMPWSGPPSIRISRSLTRDRQRTVKELEMDKAAIFADVTKRNALRRANGLPPLDIQVEYAHQVAIATQRDYGAFCDQRADKREAIRQGVTAELRLQHGPDFGSGMGGRWMIDRLTHQRFVAHIAATYRMRPEGGGRNPVVYGAGLKDA